ncbi:T9SS type A sorting domain-containing protein [Dyadobacter psychrotolerans]|uniref:T9SS type A sorting domain-containing protein n=1 Tax=Dyadobacter psychrotolerans TaxID=2541721 RepID=A0A4R5DC84_9BACT|nr:T9SS type A sorting domain-containing protein [Dyadobacter psychrotolerans]TDE09610.1 T9SS type A sorting domain-containing protein [Dyadobacter psychrotolerans]
MVKKIYFIVIFLFLFISFPSQAQGIKMPIKTYGDLMQTYRGFKQLDKLAKTLSSKDYYDCVAYSKSVGYCTQVVPICKLYKEVTSQNIMGYAGGFYKAFKLYDVFQPYCGNGTCFQCCWTNQGCHSSFIGFPVLNCNSRYGAETTPAGLTLIVDEDIYPGKICLFTGQVCSHHAKCNLNLNPKQITDANNNPLHPMKSKRAIEQRAYTYAYYALESHYQQFAESITSNRIMSGITSNAELKKLTDDDLNDFLYGRGHDGWDDLVDAVAKYRGDAEGFRMADSVTKEFLPQASMWNTNRMFFLARYLSTIPNLYNRLAFVESKIWTEEDKDAYLKTINYNDSTFLKTIHPIALNFLRQNYGIQDYRLLAVPLAGEIVQSKFYNGDVLGDPPVLAIENSESNFTFSVSNTGTHKPGKPLPILVLWGDGTTTETELNGTSTKSLSHDYPAVGEYRVIAYARNSSGLRSILMKSVNIKARGVGQTQSIKTLSFKNLLVKTGTLTFADYISFDILAKNKNDEEFQLGRTAATFLGNAANRVVDSSLVVNNVTISQFDKLIIRPVCKYEGTGFISLNIKSMQAGFFNNSTIGELPANFQISASNLKLLDKNGKVLNNKDYIITTGLEKDFALALVIQSNGVKVERIEIDLTDLLSKQPYTLPNTITRKEEDGVYAEFRLNEFFKIEPVLAVEPIRTNVPAVLLYPNPTQGKLVFSKNPNFILTNEAGLLSLYTSSGRKVKEFNVSSGQNYHEFDISDLHLGVYIWKYETKNGAIVEGKVIKQ